MAACSQRGKQRAAATGKLGWPIGDRYIDPVVGTVDQDFQYGTVFHNHVKWGSVGTHFVTVARKMGITTPKFGWATANVVRIASNGGGQYQTFTTGALTWQSAAGNYYVPTAVWQTVRANGGVSGAKIGWPTAAPTWTASSKTWKQSFKFATITCVTGKACTVKAVG